MSEIRYLTAADDQAYGRVGGYSYNWPAARIVEYVERTRRFGDRMLGIFPESGELGAAMSDRRFSVNVHGREVAANGIGMVASAPETRRHGLVREMLGWHLGELERDGVALSILYPFQYRFYQRMGWGAAARMVVVTVPPKEFAGYGREGGSTRLLMTIEPDGARLAAGCDQGQMIAWLQSVYVAIRGLYNLTSTRKVADWERRLRASRGIRYIYGWFADSGNCEGYLMCGTTDNESPTTLDVHEMFASTPAAWRGLCWFLSCHDSHIKQVEMIVPASHQLLEVLVDPRRDGKLGEGQMVRAVNVARLLEQRGPAAPGDGSFTLRVRDDLLPWNDGDFLVETAAGHVRATKLAVPLADGTADLAASIDVFSQLAVGTRSLAEMARFGLVEYRPGPGYDRAAELFPAAPVWHLEYY